APRHALHPMRDRPRLPGGRDRIGAERPRPDGGKRPIGLNSRCYTRFPARADGRAYAETDRDQEATRMRAVDALMECLKAEGVDVVFGLPGGANLPTYVAFYDAGIRHILVRHEAGGGHAAEGYAKATGKVGVSLGTSGPGATNLVTPICDA